MKGVEEQHATRDRRLVAVAVAVAIAVEEHCRETQLRMQPDLLGPALGLMISGVGEAEADVPAPAPAPALAPGEGRERGGSAEFCDGDLGG